MMAPAPSIRKVHSEFEVDPKQFSAKRYAAIMKAGTLLAPPTNPLKEKVRRLSRRLGIQELESIKEKKETNDFVDIPIF